MGIKIEAYVDKDFEKLKKREFIGVRVITFEKMMKEVQGDDSYLVQISCDSDSEIIGILKKI